MFNPATEQIMKKRIFYIISFLVIFCIEVLIALYVRDRFSSVATPIRQLKAFRKDLIKAGATNTFTLKLPISELALWNARMQEVVEPGEFEIQIGSAADNIHFTKVITVKGK